MARLVVFGRATRSGAPTAEGAGRRHGRQDLRPRPDRRGARRERPAPRGRPRGCAHAPRAAHRKLSPEAVGRGRALSAAMGFDFLVGVPRRATHRAWFSPGSRPPGRAQGPAITGATQEAARRLAILTDIVKTANSILEPNKVIELIMARVQELIPSDAWSMLMVDEERRS